jgi:hypothetical protein
VCVCMLVGSVEDALSFYDGKYIRVCEVYICVCVYMCVCIYMCVCVYMCVCIYMCVCMKWHPHCWWDLLKML